MVSASKYCADWKLEAIDLSMGFSHSGSTVVIIRSCEAVASL